MTRVEVHATRRLRIDDSADGIWVTRETLSGTAWRIAATPLHLSSSEDVEGFVGLTVERQAVVDAWSRRKRLLRAA